MFKAISAIFNSIVLLCSSIERIIKGSDGYIDAYASLGNTVNKSVSLLDEQVNIAIEEARAEIDTLINDRADRATVI